jgi:hypothetical protein
LLFGNSSGDSFLPSGLTGSLSGSLFSRAAVQVFLNAVVVGAT